LTSNKIAFKPDDWDNGRYDSWRWTSIEKHQVTSANAKKTMLKFISKEDNSKSVVFELKSHKQLKRLRQDVTERLRAAKDPSRCRSIERRMSVETIGMGDFSVDSRRNSDVTFTTVNMIKDEMDISNMSTSRSRHSDTSKIPSNVHANGKDFSRRVSGLGMEDDSSSNSWQGLVSHSPTKRCHVLLLDPKSDTNTKKINEIQSTKNSDKKKTASTTSPVSRVTRMLVLWSILLIVFTAVGKLGYFNGAIDKSSVDALEHAVSPVITSVLKVFDEHVKPTVEKVQPLVEEISEKHIKPSREALKAFFTSTPVEQISKKRGFFGKKKRKM